MNINTLKLTNFRNHKKAKFEFTPGVSIIKGVNGSGKSNIIEAVYLLATGTSPKSVYDSDLIAYDHKYCSVTAEVTSAQGTSSLDIQVIAHPDLGINASSKRIKVNKVPRTISYMAGMFNAVAFTPADLEIVLGSPSLRRKFMDNILIQTDARYKKGLTSYTKALKQRNKVLELINEFGKGYEQLDYWTQQIIEYGTVIQSLRENMFNKIAPVCSKLIQTLDHSSSKMELLYKKNEISLERIQKHNGHEIASKTTLVGPHRDDFTAIYNDRNLAQFGSRGQQRTVLLAIKLAEVNYFEQQTGEKPVVLLDDMFSELDEIHRKAVMSTIYNQQTIITTVEDLDFINNADISIISL